MANASQPVDDDFDEEIFDIFVEEATEVLETLDGDIPKWRADQGNRPVLTDIRRAFHTLKGSGRMAKAHEIAEIAWKVEQALNKALEGSLEVTHSLVDMVGRARDAIPPLVDALRNRQPVSLSDAQLAQLCAQIDAIARGETIPVLEVAMPAAAPAPVAHVPAVPALTLADLEPLQRELADLSMRIDTTTSGVDAGAKQLRDLNGRAERLESALAGTLSQHELDDVKSQMQGLLGAINELRLLVKATNDRVAQQQQEARLALDQRVTDEVASLMTRNSELKDQLQQIQQQLKDARRWTLLTVGSSVGGVFILSMLAFLLMR